MSYYKKHRIYLWDFFNEFLIYSKSAYSINHYNSLRTTFNAFLSFCGKITLNKLNRYLVITFIDSRMKYLSPYTIRRDIADLSSAFHWGINRGYLKENFTKGIVKPKIIQKLPVYFRESEFQLLVQNTEDDDLKDLFLFVINTGLRETEVCELRWSQIDLKHKTLVLDNLVSITKNKKVRAIPLNIASMQILLARERKRQTNGDSISFVFTYKREKIRQQFISHKIKKIIRKAGLRNELNFYSLRKSFGSYLAQKGVPIYNISKLMGHSDTRLTTQMYAAINVDDLRESVEILNNQNISINDQDIIKETYKILNNGGTINE